MSDDLHSHMNSVHLKIKPFETCKRLFAHKRSLEPGRYSCTVKAQDVCGHCGKVFKSRGSLEDHARSLTAVFLTPATSASYVSDTGIS